MQYQLLLSLPLALLSGCANLSTVDRRSELPNGGRAIHLDASQRLVYASEDGIVCAEPTPDALQSLAASSGGGLSLPTQGALSVTNAFEANAASIGLHTQSITLMRDQLYRICEQSYNKRITPLDVTQLLERSQDFTLGILAIEQLTGAVVARQAMLTGEGSASSSANIANTQMQLDRAVKAESDKKTAATKAADAQTAAHAALKSSTDALDAAKKAAPPPAQATLDKLTAQQSSDQKASDAADAAAKSAQNDYATAQAATEAIRDNLNAAITSANSTTKGAGAYASDSNARNSIDKDTITALAGATTEIVTTIINKGHLVDTCLNVMAARLNGTATGLDFSDIDSLCANAFNVYVKNNVGGGSTPFVLRKNLEILNMTAPVAPAGNKPSAKPAQK